MTEISLNLAEEMARVATQTELENYEIPANLMGQVVLTTLFEGDDRVFVLYVPGQTRDDPMIIAKTRVDVKTGKVSVEVPLYSKSAA